MASGWGSPLGNLSVSLNQGMVVSKRRSIPPNVLAKFVHELYSEGVASANGVLASDFNRDGVMDLVVATFKWL